MIVEISPGGCFVICEGLFLSIIKTFLIDVINFILMDILLFIVTFIIKNNIIQ